MQIERGRCTQEEVQQRCVEPESGVRRGAILAAFHLRHEVVQPDGQDTLKFVVVHHLLLRELCRILLLI